MCALRVIALMSCLYFCGMAAASPTEPYFRDDYHYYPKHRAFYKVHTAPRPWRTAYMFCELEDAVLLYPHNEAEAKMLVELFNETLPGGSSAWVGAHDLFAETVHVDLEGKEIRKGYAPWAPGEPNDSNNNEDCVALNRLGHINDVSCDSRLPALCKKSLGTLTANPICETADLAYVPNHDKTRCYKAHTIPKSWDEAFRACEAEQSYLTIINSKKEADFILDLVKTVSNETVDGKYNKNYVAVGFHDMFKEELFLTIQGQSLKEAGYSDWAKGQPDDAHGGEDCGSITLNGLLNDIDCECRMFFVCERDIKRDPNIVELFSRFGNKSLPDSKQ